MSTYMYSLLSLIFTIVHHDLPPRSKYELAAYLSFQRHYCEWMFPSTLHISKRDQEYRIKYVALLIVPEPYINYLCMNHHRA